MKQHCSTIILGSFCLLFISIRSNSIAQRKIVVDTDAGADDATALLLALKYETLHPSFLKILAVTCVYGNTYVDTVGQNILKTLTIAGRNDIPVYIGANKPLISDYVASTDFGYDGFGDFHFDEEIIAKINTSKHAVEVLIDLVKKYPGEITLLCLGPLTNIALATQLYPDFLRDVKEIFVMGASVEGIGNVSPNVEFNFNFDPESNSIILNSTPRQMITLLPWETTLRGATSKEWRMEVLGRINSSVIDFLNKANRIPLEKQNLWTPADVDLTAIMIWPELNTQSVVTNMYAVTDGAARGSVLVDYTNITQRMKNTRILQNFNVDELKRILINYLP